MLTIRRENPRADIYVIGDIHGHCDVLAALVESLPLQPDDLVVQVGDCINRGPRSFEVVEYWLQFDRCSRCVLRGNHEEMFHDYLGKGRLAVLDFGGAATLQSYRSHGWEALPGNPHTIPASHLRFYDLAYPWTADLLLTPHYLFVHAGYDLAQPPEAQQAEMLRWGSVYRHSQSRTSRTVIRGHEPYPQVRLTAEGWIGVDTGCGLGGPLSCLRLSDGRVYTVQPTSDHSR